MNQRAEQNEKTRDNPDRIKPEKGLQGIYTKQGPCQKTGLNSAGVAASRRLHGLAKREAQKKKRLAMSLSSKGG